MSRSLRTTKMSMYHSPHAESVIDGIMILADAAGLECVQDRDVIEVSRGAKLVLRLTLIPPAVIRTERYPSAVAASAGPEAPRG